MGLDKIQDGKDYTRSGSGNLTCFDDRKWKYRKRVWKGKHHINKNIRIKLIFKHEYRIIKKIKVKILLKQRISDYHVYQNKKKI